ncbi:hypothetical protein [Cohnella sp. OV330]|uniref:hypothetical protein n=1 Tax=Cohnella sp. OV330 TaxID=1855288 RepID=UPI000B7F6F31|nr:hypothetical protein [Cohnella sp. OV330]
MFQLQVVKFSDVNSLTALQSLLENSRVLDQAVNHDDWPEEELLEKGWREIPNFQMQVSQLTAGTQEGVSYFMHKVTMNARNKEISGSQMEYYFPINWIELMSLQ